MGRVYFQGRGIPIVEEFSHVVQNPTMRRAREIGDEVVRRFLDRSLDEVHILYTEMVSPLKLEVREAHPAALDRANFHLGSLPAGQGAPQEVTYVPSPEAVLDNIIPSGYIRGWCSGRWWSPSLRNRAPALDRHGSGQRQRQGDAQIPVSDL